MSEQDDLKEKTSLEQTSDADKKKKDNDGYERYCFICRRPESVTGKMIDLPTNICVCPDCMQKSFDAMNNGGFDYSKFMNMPMSPIMGFGDQEN